MTYGETVDLLADDSDAFALALAIVARDEAIIKRLRATTAGKHMKEPTLRDALDEAARIRYERDGSTKWQARLEGEPIGTYTARLTRGRDERRTVTMTVSDSDLMNFLMRDGIEYFERLVLEHKDDVLQWALADGVDIDGARVEAVTIPAEPSVFMDCALKVDEEKATALLGMGGGGFAELEGAGDGDLEEAR